MKIGLISAAALALALAPHATPSASPLPPDAFDPRDYHRRIAGEPTTVVVLATPHLSRTGGNFDPIVLDGLLRKLEKFSPDIVAIENLSGEELFSLSSYRSVYPDVAESFGGQALALASAARAYTGLDMPAAEAEVRAALSSLDALPSAERRRRITLLFLAAGDPNSALVQWWQLSPSQRIADDFPESVRTRLEAFSTKRNESALIGARLAVRLGLNRLSPIDDQTAIDLIFPVAESLGAAIEADPSIARELARPEFVRLSGAGERLRTNDETLDTYRELNAPTAGATDARAQWLSMIDRIYPQAGGRIRMAEWEARNLRIAANIREAAAAAPGGRVLVIVGASHKPWLDAYLSMMVDIRVVDARQILM